MKKDYEHESDLQWPLRSNIVSYKECPMFLFIESFDEIRW